MADTVLVGCAEDTVPVGRGEDIVPVRHCENSVPDGPIISSSASDAGDVKSDTSTSTDWEGEFGIEPSPGGVPSSITLACMYIIASSPSCLRLICLMVGTDSSSLEEECWYAVIIGRNPSVYNGS